MKQEKNSANFFVSKKLKDFLGNSKKIKLVILFSILINLTYLVYAYPPLPTEFYGDIIVYDNYGLKGYGEPGKTINAYDQNGTQCGTFNIVNSGFYGTLSCREDDNSTITDEGADNLEIIKFRYNGNITSSFGELNFISGKYHNVTIIYPKIVCGDGICMKGIESKGSLNITDEVLTLHICQADCGINIPINATPPNTTSNASIPPTSSGGGAGGGGGGSGGGGAGGNIDMGNIKNTSIPFNQTLCKEDWNCTGWGECFSNETQYRTCEDLNSCNTTKKIPPLIQECIYEGTCYDKIRNGKEQGIDCGGPCFPCPGKEHEPNCFDGIKNCQGINCEDGVDCGGPCLNSCEKPVKIEKPIKICNRPSDLFRVDFILLYILTIIFTSIYIIIEKERAQKIRKNNEIKDIEKSKKLISIKRNIIIFIIFVILLISSIISYYLFFFCSPNFYNFIKFFIPAILLIPLLAFFIMNMLEYSEKEKLQKLDKLHDTHNEHLKKLVSMQNEYLKDLEQDLSNDIYKIQQKTELKKELEEYSEIKTVYRDMLNLYDNYKTQKTAFGIEKELCDAIKALGENEYFITLSNNHKEIKDIYGKLATLYKAYEEKQELLNELKEKDALIIEKRKDNKID